MPAQKLAILHRKLPYLSLRAGDQPKIERLPAFTICLPIAVKKPLVGAQVYFIIENDTRIHRSETAGFVKVEIKRRIELYAIDAIVQPGPKILLVIGI